MMLFFLFLLCISCFHEQILAFRTQADRSYNVNRLIWQFESYLIQQHTHAHTHTRLVNTDLLVPPRSMWRPSGWTPVSINRNWGKVSQLRHRARHQADKVQWRAPTPIPTHTHTYTAIKYALSLAAQINNRPTSWWDFKWALICWELSLVTIDERRKNDRTRDGLNKHQETIRDKDGETERERQRIEKNRTELWDA